MNKNQTSKKLILSYLLIMLKVLLKMNTNLKKVQYQITNMVVYDIETFIFNRAVPFANCI